jgi:hypothetical protein
MTILTTRKAVPSLIKDLNANGIKYQKLTETSFNIEDTGKGRMAVRMVKERFGMKSIIEKV